jgi:hypothetical protein
VSHHPTAPQQRPANSVVTWFRGLSRTGKMRLLLVVIAVVVAPFAIYAGMDEPNQAKVGDCMAGQSKSDLRTVDCGDPAAQWKVLARLEGKTEADFNNDACSATAGTQASFYQDGRRLRKGFILCLGAAR